MKNLITVVICLASLSTFAQNTKSEFDSATWKAPYKLTTPNGWRVERSLLAGKISQQGIEDLRLPPGWNDSKSNEYWTYASLWTLDGDHKTDEETMEKSLTFYLTDMLNKSLEKRKISVKKISSVKTCVTELNNEKGDLKTYFGAIAIPDGKEQMPQSLHCLVHVRKCPSQNKTFIFYEFSPRSLDDAAWKTLDQLWLEFDCLPYQMHGSN